jgi:hypothetical protein
VEHEIDLFGRFSVKAETPEEKLEEKLEEKPEEKTAEEAAPIKEAKPKAVRKKRKVSKDGGEPEEDNVEAPPVSTVEVPDLEPQKELPPEPVKQRTLFEF